MTQAPPELLRLKQQTPAGKLATAKNGATIVQFRLEDGSAYPHAGQLQFSDVTVDETTGMVTLRALVPNPERLLLPGMFMRATLQQGERAIGLLVPQAAVARTPRGGSSVLIVDAKNRVEQRDIQVSQSHNGNWVVESRLQAGERVIVAGLQKVRAGAEVAP